MRSTSIDLSEAEVKDRLSSYIDPLVTTELYEFGKMLIHDAVDRMAKLDSKATTLAAYSGGLITVLVATFKEWSQLSSPAGIWLIGVAATMIFLSGASAVASMALTKTEWFTQNEWMKKECLASADRMKRYHVLTMWGIVKSHHAACRQKISAIYAAELLLILAGVVLFVALFQVARSLPAFQNESSHIESVPVKETFQGKTVWEGIVEVFELHGHPKAPKVYAWAHDTDDPENPRRHVTVLHQHPIKSAQDAVRAAIVQEYRNLGTAEEE